ncbi:hypothetical protein Droror1_Dr00017895 [Drosera rotundifolia]
MQTKIPKNTQRVKTKKPNQFRQFHYRLRLCCCPEATEVDEQAKEERDPKSKGVGDESDEFVDARATVESSEERTPEIPSYPKTLETGEGDSKGDGAEKDVAMQRIYKVKVEKMDKIKKARSAKTQGEQSSGELILRDEPAFPDVAEDPPTAAVRTENTNSEIFSYS